MLGLETALSIVQHTMVDTGLLDWAGVAERMSAAPARIGRLAGHGRPLEVGEPANVVLYDPAYVGVVDPTEPGLALAQHAVRRTRAARPGGRDVPARHADRPRREARMNTPARHSLRSRRAGDPA